MKIPASVGDMLLRVALGIMFIAHSVVLKYFTFTLAGTAQYFASIGLPAFLAYVVFAVEAIGGVLLVLGIGTQLLFGEGLGLSLPRGMAFDWWYGPGPLFG